MDLERNKIYKIDKYAKRVIPEGKYMEETRYALKVYIPCEKKEADLDLIFDEKGKFIKNVPLVVKNEYCKVIYTNHHQELVNTFEGRKQRQLSIFDFI